MNIFITGGTSGIGKALAQLYLNEGHIVGVCGGSHQEFEASWETTPENLKFYDVDVRDRKKIEESITDFCGNEIDILIASAGINQKGDNGPIPDFDLTEKIIDINVKGVINSIEAVLKKMVKNKRGHIVAIASGSGYAGFPGAAAYSSSKSAVITYMESMTIDLKQFGINCSTICPGFVNTPLVEDNGRKMPFLMEPHEAAIKIKTAIEKKKALYTFPFIVFVIMGIIRSMPRFLYRSLQKPSTLDDGKNGHFKGEIS